MPNLAELAAMSCVPCKGTKPMTPDEGAILLQEMPGWNLREVFIEKTFRFKRYLEGLDFVFALGNISEKQNHHPDMMVGWRRVKVTLSTHAIQGLSMNDFIIAARAELEFRRITSNASQVG